MIQSVNRVTALPEVNHDAQVADRTASASGRFTATRCSSATGCCTIGRTTSASGRDSTAAERSKQRTRYSGQGFVIRVWWVGQGGLDWGDVSGCRNSDRRVSGHHNIDTGIDGCATGQCATAAR